MTEEKGFLIHLFSVGSFSKKLKTASNTEVTGSFYVYYCWFERISTDVTFPSASNVTAT